MNSDNQQQQQLGNTICDLPWSIRAFFLTPIRYSGVPSIAATYRKVREDRKVKRVQFFAGYKMKFPPHRQSYPLRLNKATDQEKFPFFFLLVLQER